MFNFRISIHLKADKLCHVEIDYIFPNMDKERGENGTQRPSDEGKEWAKRRNRRMGGSPSLVKDS